jgi:hypothetical protein
MIKATEVLKISEIQRRIKRGESVSEEERRLVAEHPWTQMRTCGCGCGETLESRVDGERHKIGGVEVNSDCYFDSFDAEIGKHPIGRLGIRRG